MTFKTDGSENILTYDIESVLLLGYLFAPGKQYIGHKQLVPGRSRYGIICITYCWNNGPVQVLKWEPVGRQDKLIKDFDDLVKKADHIIGKNSDRFDNKMVNGIRIFTDQPGMPEWIRYTDDLERQARRYFRLPSQSLDYISNQFGLGGKVTMDFSDWVAIDQWMTVQMLEDDGMREDALNIFCLHMYKNPYSDILLVGQKAFDKMCRYGAKDTRDTRKLWNILSKHFEPRFNVAAFNDLKNACKRCASTDIKKNGTKCSGGTKYQEYYCNSCYQYAGRHAINRKEGGKLL